MTMMPPLDCLIKYPEVKQFMLNNKLCLKSSSHLSKTINGGYEELEFIEYFLKFSNDVKNGNNLINKILQYGTKDIDSSHPEQWHSLIIEFAAFYLLHKRYGLNVYGYEDQNNLDFAVKIDDMDVYFEIKDRCALVVQEIPKRMKKLLNDIEKKQEQYRIIPEFIDKNLKYQYLSDADVLTQIKKAITEKLKTNYRRSFPVILKAKDGREYGKIGFNFLPANNKENYFSCFLYPDSIEDIKKWLFEEGMSSRNGKKMDPQVKVAESKGADYLMCRIPFFKHGNETFSDYIKPLFSILEFINANFAKSSDSNIGKLSGIILFTSLGPLTNKYIIVNNKNVKPKIKNWINGDEDCPSKPERC